MEPFKLLILPAIIPMGLDQVDTVGGRKKDISCCYLRLLDTHTEEKPNVNPKSKIHILIPFLT